jgi:hypothetical protein
MMHLIAKETIWGVFSRSAASQPYLSSESIPQSGCNFPKNWR